MLALQHLVEVRDALEHEQFVQIDSDSLSYLLRDNHIAAHNGMTGHMGGGSPLAHNGGNHLLGYLAISW